MLFDVNLASRIRAKVCINLAKHTMFGGFIKGRFTVKPTGPRIIPKEKGAQNFVCVNSSISSAHGAVPYKSDLHPRISANQQAKSGGPFRRNREIFAE